MDGETEAAATKGLTRRELLGTGVRAGSVAIFLPTLNALLTACGASGTGSGPKKAIKIKQGSVYNADSTTGKGEAYFAQRVKELSNGEIVVNLFPNSALGSEQDEATQVRNGTIHVLVTGLAGVGTYVPELQVMEEPYMWSSVEQVNTVQQKVIGDIQSFMNPRGVHNLSVFFDGPRSAIGVKPLSTVDDFRGVKMRVPTTPLFVGLAKALGANPTPTAFNEVYTDLQTHVVDAAEGSPDTLVTKKWYEVAKDVSLTEHSITSLYMIINDQFFKTLDKDSQNVLVKAAADAAQKNVGLLKTANDDRLNQIKANGNTILNVDKSAFMDKLTPFDDSYAQSLGAQAEALYKKARQLAK